MGQTIEKQNNSLQKRIPMIQFTYSKRETI